MIGHWHYRRVVVVDERVAQERRCALRGRVAHLAGERDERLLLAVWRRDDLGGLLPEARGARRAVELSEAFMLQVPVLTDKFRGEWDAEGAKPVHVPHGLALVLALAILALDSHLKT